MNEKKRKREQEDEQKEADVCSSQTKKRRENTPVPASESGLSVIMASLESIKRMKYNANETRVLLKGDETACLELFKQAVIDDDAIMQIHISHVLSGMRIGQDNTKDFSLLSAKDLENFRYYPRGFALFRNAYDEAMGKESDWYTSKSRAREVFKKASEAGFIPALLELKCKEWSTRRECFGFAAQLKPFVGKGDKEIDFQFGVALKQGTRIGSDLYYEGMYWINNSVGFKILYPTNGESFYDFTTDQLRYRLVFATYYTHDGFIHYGASTILVPSKKAWNDFLRRKLENIKFAPNEKFSFEFDPKQLGSLLEEHKIGFVHTAYRDNDTVCIYKDPAHKIGEVSVQGESFRILRKFKSDIEYIQPVLDFIEEIMRRTGSAGSAIDWLEHIKDTHNEA